MTVNWLAKKKETISAEYLYNYYTQYTDKQVTSHAHKTGLTARTFWKQHMAQISDICILN